MKRVVTAVVLALVSMSAGSCTLSNGEVIAPAATHALPPDPKAAVIVFDWVGGFTPDPLNNDPVMVIRSDGTVVLGNRFRNNARVETGITKDDLQELLRFAIDTNDFFKIDTAAVKQAVKEEIDRRNEAAAKAAGSGARAVYDLPVDAATVVVRIHADGKEHEVRCYTPAMDPKTYPGIERLAQLHAIATRLRQIQEQLRAGGTQVKTQKHNRPQNKRAK